MKAAPSVLLLVGIMLAAQAAAQAPAPSPPPERTLQDELDLQANANFVQGSGARAFGMGGAFLARPDDATAASWNPAGLSYLKAPEFSFVGLGNDFDVDRQPVPRGDVSGFLRDRRRGRYLDFAAFTLPWEAGSVSGAVQVSFQRVLPFKSERTITLMPLPDAEQPREEPREERTIDSRGGFDVFALGAGARVSRKLRLGLTLNRWFNGYDQTRLRPDLDVTSRQETDLRLSGWNMHLGLIFSPWERLNLGAVLKTAFTAGAVLDRVRYDQYGPLGSAESPSAVCVRFELPSPCERTVFNIYSRDDVRIALPRAMGVGLSWRPRSNLTLSADFTRTTWSSGRIHNFFTLARASVDTPLARPVPDPPQSGDFCGVYGPDDRRPDTGVIPCPPVLAYPTLGSDQKDTVQIRAGFEYVVIKGRLKFPLRAGVFRDSQFFPSLEGDAPTFTGYTLGTGLILSDVLLDVAYVLESGLYTDSAGSENDVSSKKFFASIIYRLPRRH